VIKQVWIKPNQIQQQLGQKVDSAVNGYARNGKVVLIDPSHPQLFGLELETGETSDATKQRQVQLG